MHAIVVADGDRPARAALDAAWPGWDADAALVVAADGGARAALELGLTVDVWVGDGDSLDVAAVSDLERTGVRVVRVRTDKDESDTELALAMALDLGASRVTILGALGGRRFDHALANVGLLRHPLLDGRPVCLVDERNRVSLVEAPGADGRPLRRRVAGRVGDMVSLLPLCARVEGITTTGLRYPLTDEPLEPGPARGLSNVRERPDASVTVRQGRLLVVESAATLDG